MRYNRYLPIILPLLILVLLETLNIWPKQIYVVFILSILLIFFASRQMLVASDKNEKWWNIAILPVCLTAGILAFSSITVSDWVVQVLFVLNTVVLYSYFITIYHYLLKPRAFNRMSLENLSSYGNFLAVYFIASAVYGLASFLNISIWLLMIFFLVFLILIVYQVLWANSIVSGTGAFYVLLLSLVLTELAWAASFLPLSFYVLGLVIAVFYYILIGLAKFHLLAKLNQNIVKSYLVFGFLSILIVMLTARWL